MINKDSFSMRIANANPAQMVVINFELVIAFIDDGQIEKAKNGLEQLVRSLNFEIPLAHDFYDIYRYINELLVRAQLSQDKNTADNAAEEARELLETLLVGWQDVEKQVADLPPVAGESPKVYSGLTYSNDGKADEYIDDDNKKGYMA
jgi:hypothetical protein